MALQDWLAFVGASIGVLVVPGPTIMTVTSYSLAHGSEVRPLLVAAVALGDWTAVCASLLGLGLMLEGSSMWFTLLRGVGAVYLVYLGARQFQRQTLAASDIPIPPMRPKRMFASVFAISAVNPKGLIFYVGFFPQFVNPEVDVSKQLWLMAVTFVVLTTLNAVLYVRFASLLRHVLASTRARRAFDRVGGSLLVTAGISALCVSPPT